MRRPRQMAGCALALCCGSAAAGQVVVLPNASATTAYGAGANYIITDLPMSYQVQIAASELGALPPGARITGIQWRLFPNLFSIDPWPPKDVEWQDYTITLAKAGGPLAQMSTTFAANTVDPVTVQSGLFTIPAGNFPGGVTSAPAVNAWGSTLPFQTPYVYQGGDLVITVRHGTGNFTIALNHLDVLRPTDPPGGLVRAMFAPSATATTGTLGNTFSTICRLVYEEGACYPDCNGDQSLNLADFGCFQTKFALGDMYADCNGDQALNLADFGCFQTEFALGCP